MNDGPVIYLDWVICLDLLEEGEQDEVIMERMCRGKMPDTPEVFNRVIERFIDVVTSRFSKASEEFQKVLKRGYNEGDWMKAISLFRKRLTKIWQVSQLTIIPDEVRKEMDRHLDEAVEEIQKKLVDSFSQNEPSGKLAYFIKSNPVYLEKIPYQPAITKFKRWEKHE